VGAHRGRASGSREAYALAIDPQNPSTVYAAAASFAGPQMGGVFKSEDGGTTWTQANAGLTDIEAYALVMDPQTPSTLYVGTEGGLFKSIDGAATWAATGITDEVRTIAIDAAMPSVVWVGTETGLAKSTDGGLTWTQSTLGLAGEVDAIAINPVAPATVYAGGRNMTTWKTTDGGGTWTRLIDSPEALQLAVDPSAPSTVYLVIGSLFKSRNAGGTWQRSEGGMHAQDATSVVVVADAPDTIYAANFHTMYTTIDGGTTWTHAIVPTSDVFSLAYEPRRRILSFVSHPSGGHASAYWSRDGGATWRIARGLDTTQPTSLVADPTNPRVLYAGTFGGGVFRSRNGGRRWNALRTSPPDEVMLDLAVDPATPTTLYATTGTSGVFKTVNLGTTWSAINAGLTEQLLGPLAIDPSAPATIYVGGYAAARVFKSTDGGASWSEGSAGLPPGVGYAYGIGDLLVDPTAPSTVYASVKHAGIFRSVDGGATWSDYNLGMTAAVAYQLLVAPPGSSIYAGTPQGVFRLVP